MIGQSTYSQVTSMIPVVGFARAEKASGKRSRWFVPHPGHSSTIIAVMLFPEGPVTDTHAPQLAELSQLESDKAVPKMPEGRV